MLVQHFFDTATYSLTYVAFDPQSKDAMIIDPVLHYDPGSSTVSDRPIEPLKTFIEEKGLRPQMILETHVHADHFSAAKVLQSEWGGVPIAISDKVTVVQRTFADIFDFSDFLADGSQFDRLLQAGEVVRCGSLSFKVLPTPGHTPACCSYLFERAGAVFVGDALFMPDFGCGRCDFPGGDAALLYQSIHSQIYTLPGDALTYTAHDYQPNGRMLQYSATVAAQRDANIQIAAATTEEEFVTFRQQRDATLSAPNLLYPSIQFNMAGGAMPDSGSDRPFLKIPISLP